MKNHNQWLKNPDDITVMDLIMKLQEGDNLNISSVAVEDNSKFLRRRKVLKTRKKKWCSDDNSHHRRSVKKGALHKDHLEKKLLKNIRRTQEELNSSDVVDKVQRVPKLKIRKLNSGRRSQ